MHIFFGISAKPDVPTVRIPTEIIDSREPREWFRCEGNVGYPKGRMYWEIKMKGDADFTDKIPFKTKRDSENTTNCKTYVTNEFRFTPSALHDGMEVRCVVENQDTMPGGRRLYTTKEIHVIPGMKLNQFELFSQVFFLMEVLCLLLI